MPIARLPARAVVEVTGEDRVGFLQGLVSNDVTLAAPGRAVFAAMLTPQGKWLCDFFILAEGERLLLETEEPGAAALARRLARYRLRAKVGIRVAEELAAHAGWGGAAQPPGIGAPDPRLPAAGFRLLAGSGIEVDATAADWDAHRLALGLPEAADMEPEQTVLLEAGFGELNGISWTKGCYLGQELTARTHYRGLLKRRLLPVAVEGPLPPPGTPILDGAGVEQGTIRSGRGLRAMATLRLAALDAGPLHCGEARLLPWTPAWLGMGAVPGTKAQK